MWQMLRRPAILLVAALSLLQLSRMPERVALARRIENDPMRGNSADLERLALARIAQLGGTCLYRHQVTWEPAWWYCFGPCNVRWDKSIAKSWRVAGMPDPPEIAAPVPDFVFLNGTDASDDDLKLIGRLRTVRTLGLADTRITGEGLTYLSGMDSLVALDLSETGLKDDDLRHLRRLEQIIILELNYTSISDGGLRHLPHESLCRLGLFRTAMTTDCFVALQQFPVLESVIVSGPRLSKEDCTSAAASLPALKRPLTLFCWNWN